MAGVQALDFLDKVFSALDTSTDDYRDERRVPGESSGISGCGPPRMDRRHTNWRSHQGRNRGRQNSDRDPEKFFETRKAHLEVTELQIKGAEN